MLLAQRCRSYGVSAVWFLAQWHFQEGRCAICRRAEKVAHPRTGTQYKLAIDHDHRTGRARGLLCMGCNAHLSWLDMPPLAVQYLHQATERL